jgi:hypothetical protein
VSQLSGFDLAILAVNQPGIDLSQILSQKIPVLDCTNSYTNIDGVVNL